MKEKGPDRPTPQSAGNEHEFDTIDYQAMTFRYKIGFKYTFMFVIENITISAEYKVVWILNSVNCHLGETWNAEITF